MFIQAVVGIFIYLQHVLVQSSYHSLKIHHASILSEVPLDPFTPDDSDVEEAAMPLVITLPCIRENSKLLRSEYLPLDLSDNCLKPRRS